MVFINFFTFIGILLSILGLFFLILGLDNYIPIVARMMFLGIFILGIFIIGLSSHWVLMSIKILILESIGLFILNIFLIHIKKINNKNHNYNIISLNDFIKS